MKRIYASAPRIRRERRWPEDLPADPRDPDVVRVKTLARARLAGSSRTNRAAGEQMHSDRIELPGRRLPSHDSQEARQDCGDRS
jgi:hypothetical protein